MGMFDDWYNHVESFVFFLTGYLITTIDGVWDVIVSKRKLSLIIGGIPALFLILCVWGPTFYIMNEETQFFNIFYTVLIQVFPIGILYAILGYGKMYLNKPSKLLAYANESVLSFLYPAPVGPAFYWVFHSAIKLGNLSKISFSCC